MDSFMHYTKAASLERHKRSK